MKKLIPILLILLVGCYSKMLSENLNGLVLGMSENKAEAIMKTPGTLRGSIYNKWNQEIRIREYALWAPFSTGRRVSYYLLYFCEGKLIQWGELGDWRREQDRIYEIRFR